MIMIVVMCFLSLGVDRGVAPEPSCLEDERGYVVDLEAYGETDIPAALWRALASSHLTALSPH